jgi:hypothetical protein
MYLIRHTLMCRQNRLLLSTTWYQPRNRPNHVVVNTNMHSMFEVVLFETYNLLSKVPCWHRLNKNLILTIIYWIIMQQPPLMAKWPSGENYAACHHTKQPEWSAMPSNRLNNVLSFSTLHVLHETVHNNEASVTDTRHYFQYFLLLHPTVAPVSCALMWTPRPFVCLTQITIMKLLHCSESF